MACSYHVRKDCWYYPWIKSMLGWVGLVLGRTFLFSLSPFACTFVSGTLTSVYGHPVIASSESIWLHPWPFLPTFPSATVPLQGPTALTAKMLCFPYWHSPAPLDFAVHLVHLALLGPVTWTMGRAEWRKKETMGRGVAGRRERQ